jgi:translation initiation factor IF-3
MNRNFNNFRGGNRPHKPSWMDTTPEVRLIDENGTMVGIVPIQEAKRRAREAELQLVNISPNAVPPVCKICDYGKYKYELAKKSKNSKSVKKTKEIQFTMNIGKNDLDIKINKAKEFLEDKIAVQLVLQLKGRDMQRSDVAMELMKSVCETLKPFCKTIDAPKMNGKRIITMCR